MDTDVFVSVTINKNIYYLSIISNQYIAIFLQKWFDGGFTDNLPSPPQGQTVLVSPFSGNSDICPRDSSRPLSEFYWRKMHVLVNKENARRGLNILYPPTTINMDTIFCAGFDDAMRYIKENNI